VEELGKGKRQLVRIVIDPSLSLFDGQYYAILNDGLPRLFITRKARYQLQGRMIP
jgi:hypothetical protein